VTSDPGAQRYTGGCFCGNLRYEAQGAPLATGHCYCADCQKVSGSGFLPFMLFPAGRIRITGRTRQLVSRAANGGIATRNFCWTCGSLVFSGEPDKSDQFTVYAGTLDDASLFHPRIAIFTRSRPDWASLPDSITKVFARMPGDTGSTDSYVR
jgi:hypothetical protein